MKNLIAFALLSVVGCAGSAGSNPEGQSCDLDGVYRQVYTPESSDCPKITDDVNTYHHLAQDCNQAINDLSFSGGTKFTSTGYLSCEPGNDRTYVCDGEGTYTADTTTQSLSCSYFIKTNHICNTGEPASICK